MHADDNFDRTSRSEEANYFHMKGTAQLRVPKGQVRVEIMKRLEHDLSSAHDPRWRKPNSRLQVQLKRVRLPVPNQLPTTNAGSAATFTCI